MQLETKFNVNDRVEIIEISRTGTITGIGWDGVRLEYRVRYFDNSSLQSVAFYDDEIRLVKQ